VRSALRNRKGESEMKESRDYLDDVARLAHRCAKSMSNRAHFEEGIARFYKVPLEKVNRDVSEKIRENMRDRTV